MIVPGFIVAPMRRFLPLFVLVSFAVAGFLAVRGLGWETLTHHQAMLAAWVTLHPIISAVVYLLAYILTGALALPQAALLTVAGGLLFGTLLAFVLTIVGATIGASILLVIVRSAFARTLDRYRDLVPQHIQARLARDGFSYLLALRLLPLIPFWIVNLAVAVAGIRLAVFIPVTLLGIAPNSFLLASIGAGLGTILSEGRIPDLSLLYSARILLPLGALAVLSLLPALLRRRPRAHA